MIWKEREGLRFDQTLIVWMGEFGRTPRLNQNISRASLRPQCFTALLAGGGVKRGYVHGIVSDKQGAYPDKDPVRLDDLTATIFELMGINPESEVHDKLNRPLPISGGQVVTGVIA